jgi:hypothetical protein
MSAAKVKARKYWRGRNTCVLYPKKESAVYYAGFGPYAVNSVFLLPADAESIERMVAQIQDAMLSEFAYTRTGEINREGLARAALAAIGVKAKGGTKFVHHETLKTINKNPRR